jgi:hypothetical protein
MQDADVFREIRPRKSIFRRMYCAVLLFFVGRALQAASRVDAEIKREISALPDGFVFLLRVLPHGPGTAVRKVSGRLKYMWSMPDPAVADVDIMLKHMAAAFLLLTFQEGTAVSFASDRMVVKGDLPQSMVIVRRLNILEVYLLPAFLARRAVKRYPRWGFFRKHVNRVRIYWRTIIGY